MFRVTLKINTCVVEISITLIIIVHDAQVYGQNDKREEIDWTKIDLQ